MRPPTLLVTNDDGIDSTLLAALVRALLPLGRVTVAAPTGERSWIGKAIGRHRPELRTTRCDSSFGCPAWAIDGTPADCVNLALGHLTKGPVDMVVSGINMGSNAGLPLILASGTVGAALEGALAGTRAVATSIRLARADFERLKRPDTTLPPRVAATIDTIAQHTATLCARLLRRPRPASPIVHNLNFPPRTRPDTPLLRTAAARIRVGPLWVPSGKPGRYRFNFAVGDETPQPYLTDRACIDADHATHTILDFGRLAVTRGALQADALGTPAPRSRRQ